jgi:hypothetical protein
LKLKAQSIANDALDRSPTITALGCSLRFEERHPAFGLFPAAHSEGEC